jgi:hypothetical protein
MPSALALRVISLANSSSVPPMASATTAAASFADLVTNPLMASSTQMFWLALRPSLTGRWMAAWVETGNEVSSLSFPASSCSNKR